MRQLDLISDSCINICHKAIFSSVSLLIIFAFLIFCLRREDIKDFSFSCQTEQCSINIRWQVLKYIASINLKMTAIQSCLDTVLYWQCTIESRSKTAAKRLRSTSCIDFSLIKQRAIFITLTQKAYTKLQYGKLDFSSFTITQERNLIKFPGPYTFKRLSFLILTGNRLYEPEKLSFKNF